VVAEGEGTEYDYLGYLNTFYGSDFRFLIRSPNQRRGLSPSQVVEEAADAVEEQGIQIWGLFDHDGRPDIDQVCARARRLGINAALSHPSFELWLLLHFQDFATAQSGSNNVIMDRLRAAHPAFSDYGEGNKRIDARRFDVLNEDDRIRKAVERAKRLSVQFAHQTPSKRDPSTDVYRLIERLGIVQQPRRGKRLRL
jgi:hypothetical protein